MIWRSRSVRRTGSPPRFSSSRSRLKVNGPKTICSISGFVGGRAALQDVVDAQQQFARLERLGQIVVGAGFQAGDAAFALGARRQHQDRHVHRLAQALDQRHAVLARHHHVDDEQIEGEAGEPLARFGGVAGDGDAEAVVAEVAREQHADALVVVDDEEVRRVVGERAFGFGAAMATVRGAAHRSMRRATLSRSSGVDDAAQELLGAFALGRRQRGQRLAEAARLQVDEAERQRAAGFGRVEQALAAVERPGLLLDEAVVDELLQDAAEALLGDLEDVEEVGDADAGMAVDEMDDAVMGAAEAVAEQRGVGIGDEVAIGEEEKLDERDLRLVARRRAAS